MVRSDWRSTPAARFSSPTWATRVTGTCPVACRRRTEPPTPGAGRSSRHGSTTQPRRCFGRGFLELGRPRRTNAPLGVPIRTTDAARVPLLRRGLVEDFAKPVEPLAPSVLVEFAPLHGRERPLYQAELGASALVRQRQLGQGFLVVGGRRVPNERVCEARRCVYCTELTGEVEEVALRRLHRDPVSPADARVEVDTRAPEPVRPPPDRQLVRARQRFVNPLARRRQNAPK